MPRFYFHVHNGRDLLDTDGVDLQDEATARLEAVRLAGAMLKEDAERIVRGAPWSMDVTDASGGAVYRIRFNAEGRTARPPSGERGPGAPRALGNGRTGRAP